MSFFVETQNPIKICEDCLWGLLATDLNFSQHESFVQRFDQLPTGCLALSQLQADELHTIEEAKVPQKKELKSEC
jgi:hypothetical protein